VLSRIVIRSEFGAISIQTQHAQIQCRPARYELNMQGNASAQVSIDSEPPQLHIDQSESFASAGYLSPLRQYREYSAAAMQRGIDQIGRIAQEGLQFLKIENLPNRPFGQIAAAKGYKDVHVNIKAVKPPTIEVTRTPIKIKFTGLDGLESDWALGQNNSEYIPGKVTISWATRPSIEISVEPGVELSFPLNIGSGAHVDQAI